ncbi:unnamed protein product, partial [Ilex paraguariensis]
MNHRAFESLVEDPSDVPRLAAELCRQSQEAVSLHRSIPSSESADIWCPPMS